MSIVTRKQSFLSVLIVKNIHFPEPGESNLLEEEPGNLYFLLTFQLIPISKLGKF